MEEVPTYFAMDITDLFRTHVLHDSAATMCSALNCAAAAADNTVTQLTNMQTKTEPQLRACCYGLKNFLECDPYILHQNFPWQ